MGYTSRRDFLKYTGMGAMALAAGGTQLPAVAAKREYSISLAGWSLHKTIGRREGQKDMLEMPKMTRDEWDIDAIELVNGMLPQSDALKNDMKYYDQLAKNAADNNVKILLIMIDGQGNVGTKSDRMLERTVENHNNWIDVAAGLGCHSVRMNWGGAPKGWEDDEALLDAFVEMSVPGFRAICDHGDKKNINVTLENHWGPSSYIEPMKKLMKAVDHERFGTLPDFGNFPEDVDKYEAIDFLMNHAKAVSAKCYDFDDETGEETKIDYERMISLVHDKHGYNGFIGIEYEGGRLSEIEGIKRCNELLKKLRG